MSTRAGWSTLLAVFIGTIVGQLLGRWLLEDVPAPPIAMHKQCKRFGWAWVAELDSAALVTEGKVISYRCSVPGYRP